MLGVWLPTSKKNKGSQSVHMMSVHIYEADCKCGNACRRRMKLLLVVICKQQARLVADLGM